MLYGSGSFRSEVIRGFSHLIRSVEESLTDQICDRIISNRSEQSVLVVLLRSGSYLRFSGILVFWYSGVSLSRYIFAVGYLRLGVFQVLIKLESIRHGTYKSEV